MSKAVAWDELDASRDTILPGIYAHPYLAGSL